MPDLSQALVASVPIVQKLIAQIINPLIRLLFVGGFLVFFYGIVVFLWKTDDSGAREDGRRHMMWGVIGMFIMVAVFGLMAVIRSLICDLMQGCMN